jgi:hypothetical protein
MKHAVYVQRESQRIWMRKLMGFGESFFAPSQRHVRTTVAQQGPGDEGARNDPGVKREEIERAVLHCLINCTRPLKVSYSSREPCFKQRSDTGHAISYRLERRVVFSLCQADGFIGNASCFRQLD